MHTQYVRIHGKLEVLVKSVVCPVFATLYFFE